MRWLTLPVFLGSLAAIPRAHACGGGGSYVGDRLYGATLACGDDGCLTVYDRGGELTAARVGWDDRVERLGRPHTDDLGYSLPLLLVHGDGGYLLIEEPSGTSLVATALGADGRAIGPHLGLTSSSADPVAIWDGTAYLVVWSTQATAGGPVRLTMARIAGDGQLLDLAVLADGVRAVDGGAVAAASSGGVTWIAWPILGATLEDRLLAGVRLGADGARLDAAPIVLLEGADRPRLAGQDGRFLLIGDDLSGASARSVLLDGEGPTAPAAALTTPIWILEALGLHPLAGGWVLTYSSPSWDTAGGVEALHLTESGAPAFSIRLAEGDGAATTTAGDRLVAASVLWSETGYEDTARQDLLLTREEGDGSLTIVTVDQTTLHWEAGCAVAAGRAGGRAAGLLGLMTLALALARRRVLLRALPAPRRR